MQEDHIHRGFAERVMEGLSKRTLRRLRKLNENPMKDVRPTAVGIQPFAPHGVAALKGTAGTSGTVGLHNQGW